MYCDTKDGEKDLFGVASEHRPDLPKPFDTELQEWVNENSARLEPGDSIEEAGELEYESNEIVKFRK